MTVVTVAREVSAGRPGARVTNKKNIVICGYPKSGTTWLSRLVAELVACPLVGALGFAAGAAREGHRRVSEYDCYTSHHTFDSLTSGRLGEYFRLIYIVRDPRDVAISAAHHFRVNLLPEKPGSSRAVAALKMRVNRAVPYFVKRRRLIRAVLYGDSALSDWLATPWLRHYLPFKQSATLILKYEGLLDDPAAQCVEILSYLGVDRSTERIEAAIHEQSFRNQKAWFRAQGLTAEYAFLRRGSSGYWRAELSRGEKQRFVDELGSELAALSYAID